MSGTVISVKHGDLLGRVLKTLVSSVKPVRWR